METEFAGFLEHFAFYCRQSRTSLLLDSQHAVLAAEQGRMLALTRLFFDFPWCYTITQQSAAKTFSALGAAKKERWLRRFMAVLTQGKFTPDGQDASFFQVVDEATRQLISNLCLDILINACADLLSAPRQLRPEVISLFGLTNLLRQHESNPESLHHIICSVVYSYWLEIVFVNLGLHAIQQDCNIAHLEACNRYAKELLFVANTCTPFLSATVSTYFTVYVNSGLAACLQDLPADRIFGSLHVAKGIDVDG